MVITITVPNDVVEENKEYFFLEMEIPLLPDGTPEYTEVEWFKEVMRRYIVQTFRRGKKRAASNAAEFNDSNITVT